MNELFSAPVELQSGCLYAIQCEGYLSERQRDVVRLMLKQYKKSHNVDFIVLEGALKLVVEPATQMIDVTNLARTAPECIKPTHGES